MATIQEAMAMADQRRQTGKLADAEHIYRQVVAAAPDYAPAWQLLGLMALERGRHAEAVESLRRAAALLPDQAEGHFNLGVALADVGAHAEAAASYRRAVEISPEFAAAHHNLGVALGKLGQLEAALSSLRRASELVGDAEALNKLGIAFVELGEWDDAAEALERAVQLRGDFFEALYNLGILLDLRHEGARAAECYRRALEIDPRQPVLENNLGSILGQQGDASGAIDCYRRAVALDPAYAEAHSNLGNALAAAGRLDEAIESYRRAIAAAPRLAAAHNNLALAFDRRGEHLEAAACFRRAIEIEPESARSIAGLVRQLQHVCQWQGLAELEAKVVECVNAETASARDAPVSPFIFLSVPTTHEEQLRCARLWAAGEIERSLEGQLVLPPRGTKSKIAIGYLSADFYDHATAKLMAELFEAHDRQRFEVIAYSYGPDDGSPLRQRVVRAFDRFVDVRHHNHRQAAERIAGDGIDILIDLKGYTQDARTRIVAQRPAAVQVSYLGYPGTLGAPFIDYVLVDDFVVPAEEQPYYTERLVHLPGCYQVNDRQRQIADRAPTRRKCDLPDDAFVFCSFNNNYKITPAMFDAWMEVLRATPYSVLWLLAGTPAAADNLRREAAARGVAPRRLVFAPRLPLADHLARHRQAQLFLDTAPYNAHTTASEALWAGCPVLTLAGATFASRVAGSLLRAVGLEELVTSSLADYRDLAIELARDRERLASIAARLEQARLTAAVFDGRRFARGLERAYETMWELHRAGQQPRAFAVSAESPPG